MNNNYMNSQIDITITYILLNTTSRYTGRLKLQEDLRLKNNDNELITEKID